MQVTFYLTEASANTAAGPFNISGTTSGGAANTVLIQADVSKAVLLTGYTEEIANNITGGTVTSTDGTCNTTDTWSIDELYTGLVPETSILSYTFSGGYYYFTLSEALQDSITITLANVNGHTSAGCGSAAEDTAQLQSPVTITAGETQVQHDSGVGEWAGINYIQPAIAITLTTFGVKSDGSTFNVESGTVVTVDINASCQIYQQ
jgi:hypothetical protein